MSTQIIWRHRSAPRTASSLWRAFTAFNSVGVSAGHACGQSQAAIDAIAIPTAVRIFAIGSPKPAGRISRIAAFSSSDVCGGTCLPSPSCQCSLTYFFRTTAASCLVPYGSA
jgi:hypothetical protein